MIAKIITVIDVCKIDEGRGDKEGDKEVDKEEENKGIKSVL